MKNNFSQKKRSNSIYERSKLSEFNNNFVLKHYSILIPLFIAFQVVGVIIDWINGCQMPIKRWIRCILGDNHFTILALVVTLLSVIIASFSIAFGSFKICNINANLVLKLIHVNKKRNYIMWIMVFIMVEPVIMIIALAARWDLLFFLAFIIAFLNMFFELDIFYG